MEKRKEKSDLTDLERILAENRKLRENDDKLREKICSLISENNTLYKANRWLTWTAIVFLIMFWISLVVYTLK